MNVNKNVRPDLLDPIVEKKIMKVLNPPVEDYWAPAKTGLRGFYHNYIRPNVWLLVFIVIIILILYYRYRKVKADREKEQYEDLKTYNSHHVGGTNTLFGDYKQAAKKYSSPKYNRSKYNTNHKSKEYTDFLVDLYNANKEKLREPLQIQPQIQPRIQSQPQLAYPMYPYQGGTLISQGSR